MFENSENCTDGAVQKHKLKPGLPVLCFFLAPVAFYLPTVLALLLIRTLLSYIATL